MYREGTRAGLMGMHGGRLAGSMQTCGQTAVQTPGNGRNAHVSVLHVAVQAERGEVGAAFG